MKFNMKKLPTIQQAAKQIIDLLEPKDVAYIKSKPEQSPFSLLHDFCDANMLIAGAEDCPLTDEDQDTHDAWTAYANKVMDEFNRQFVKKFKGE